MNVTQVNSNNYKPQFGNVIIEKGGKNVLKQLVREGNTWELSKVFKEAKENFAADIFVGDNGIGVLDKLTGKKYFPSGKLLQKGESDLAVFKEAELLDGSSKQAIPAKDSSDVFDYLYLGEKDVSDGGFFSEPKFVNDYFKPQKESSYIIRQERKGYRSRALYESESRLFADEESPVHQLVTKFNAAIQIAHDIKYHAEVAINNKTKDAAKAVDEFVNHLVG